MADRSTLRTTAITVMLPALLVAGTVWLFSSLRPVNPRDTSTALVTITPKSGVHEIAGELRQQGLIRNRTTFEIAVWLAGMHRRLKAGSFELSRSMSATAIAQKIGKDPIVPDVVITIPEGWTAQEIGTYLEKKGIGTRGAFVEAASVRDSRELLPNDRFDFLAERPSGASIEGYLFPDTYRVFPDSNPKDVIKKMLTNFGTKVTPELRDELSRSKRTLFDAVTLASIVEREVRGAHDRSLVADIFWRRLQADIPLQSDATVNYVTGKHALQPSQEDTTVDSPYNTYRYRGLPPGPIGNPGLESITAVLRPQSSDYFYFLTDAQSSVHYAKTFEEHLSNKTKYLP